MPITWLMKNNRLSCNGWLCFTSHRQRGHLETAHPFTVPCEGPGDRFLHRESNPGPSRGSTLFGFVSFLLSNELS